jgi:phosphate:Na+ symporter
VVRAAGCVVVLPFLSPIAGVLAHAEPAGARLAVNFHSTFNLALAIVFLPLTNRFAALLLRLFPDPAPAADPAKPIHLEEAALETASVALANATRETLRMADMFEILLREAFEVFQSADRHRAREISRTERIMDRLGAAIRRYLADIGNEQPLDDEDEGARGQEILSAIINLEHAADIVANNLLEFAARRARRAGGFSAQELEAIGAMHAELVQSLRLGLTVFLRGDAALREARLLMTRKRLTRRLELEATGLRSRSQISDAAGGVAGGIDNSDFLRIMRDLRRVHSHIAALAYPVLERASEGDLDDREPTTSRALPVPLPADVGDEP